MTSTSFILLLVDKPGRFMPFVVCIPARYDSPVQTQGHCYVDSRFGTSVQDDSFNQAHRVSRVPELLASTFCAYPLNEPGFDSSFELLVLRLLSHFHTTRSPRRSAWIIGDPSARRLSIFFNSGAVRVSCYTSLVLCLSFFENRWAPVVLVDDSESQTIQFSLSTLLDPNRRPIRFVPIRLKAPSRQTSRLASQVQREKKKLASFAVCACGSL